jgi:ABC-type transporter Mla subunit MlaD
MKAPRNEIRTGLLVVLTLAVLVATLIYLGAPGVFQKQHTYFVYFENAFGIKPGADVMVAGRKAGQVRRVFSPVAENARPEPGYESLIEVRVAANAGVYNRVRVQMLQLSMLGDSVIDFSEGEEASGLAPDRAHFLGRRQPGLSDAVPQVLGKLDPVLQKTSATLDSLLKTSDNLNRLTSDGADLQLAFAEFHKFGLHLSDLSGPSGPLRRSLENIDGLTAPGSPLARTLENTEQVTGALADNHDIEVALRNLRQASEKMNRTMADLSPRISVIGQNLEQASDTLKREPWRLVWPASKKYEEDNRLSPPERRAPDRATRRR